MICEYNSNYITLYKHKNNTDVAVEVVKKFHVKNKDTYKLTIKWWNIVKSHKPYCMDVTQKIEIPRGTWVSDWSRWLGEF